MEPPVECSLTDADARTQVEQWRSLLGGAVHGVAWTSPASVRIRANRGVSAGALADLMEREVACCPFFRFSIEIEAAAVVLSAAVPDGAESILREFVATVAATKGAPVPAATSAPEAQAGGSP